MKNPEMLKILPNYLKNRKKKEKKRKEKCVSMQFKNYLF